MRVPEFNEFDTDGLLMASKQRNWLWFGLIVSLALHIALCTYFYRTRFQSVDTTMLMPAAQPTFKVRNVDLSPQLDKNSMDQSANAAKPEPDAEATACRKRSEGLVRGEVGPRRGHRSPVTRGTARPRRRRTG